MFEDNLSKGSSFLISATNSADTASASYYGGAFATFVVNFVAILAYIILFLIILRSVLRFAGFILQSFGVSMEGKMQNVLGGKQHAGWKDYFKHEVWDILLSCALAMVFFTGLYGNLISGGVNLMGRTIDSLTDANISGIVRTGDEFKEKVQNFEYDESVRLYQDTSNKMKEDYENLKNKSNVDKDSDKIKKVRNSYAQHYAESEILSQHITENYGSDLQDRGKSEEDFQKHKKQGVDGETQYIPSMMNGSEQILDQYGVSK